MAYDFDAMGPDELRTALNGPTGDLFLRQIADAALNLAEKSHATNEMVLTALERTPPTLPGTFGWVLEGLRVGKRYARTGWNSKGMFLFLVPGSPELTVDEGRPLAKAGVPVGTQFHYLPHIDLWTANDTVVPWQASQADVLASDWEEV